MTPAALTPQQRRLGLTAAYACVFGTTIGLGLTLPLLPLEIERAGYSAFFNGLNGTLGGLTLAALPLRSGRTTVEGLRA